MYPLLQHTIAVSGGIDRLIMIEPTTFCVTRNLKTCLILLTFSLVGHVLKPLSWTSWSKSSPGYTSEQEKLTLLNSTLVNSYNHLLPGLMLSDLPHVSPDYCHTDFSAEKKRSIAYCVPLTPLKPMGMMISQLECSRRLQ